MRFSLLVERGLVQHIPLAIGELAVMQALAPPAVALAVETELGIDLPLAPQRLKQGDGSGSSECQRSS